MSKFLKAQGAIELPAATAHTLRKSIALPPRQHPMLAMRGQGATEYLVLLAVVLIISLVSIALLGFFPGVASDSQITESQLYWRSASPLSVEVQAAYIRPTLLANHSLLYFRVRNNGGYTIRLSKIIGGGRNISEYDGPYSSGIVGVPLSNIELAPGQEACFGNDYLPGAPCPEHSVWFDTYPSGHLAASVLEGLAANCDQQGKGVLVIDNFGFEYTAYVEGQQVLKRQVGAKPIMVKCMGRCNSILPVECS